MLDIYLTNANSSSALFTASILIRAQSLELLSVTGSADTIPDAAPSAASPRNSKMPASAVDKLFEEPRASRALL